MKLFKEDGFPTANGLQQLKPLQDCLDKLFDSESVKNMNAMQTRTLGSWLAKMVGDTVSKNLTAKSQKIDTKEWAQMTLDIAKSKLSDLSVAVQNVMNNKLK